MMRTLKRKKRWMKRSLKRNWNKMRIVAAPKRKRKQTTMNQIRGVRYVKTSEKTSKKPT